MSTQNNVTPTRLVECNILVAVALDTRILLPLPCHKASIQRTMAELEGVVGCASAPGKAILFGEHSVVHGRKAIAAALCDLRVTAFTSLVDAPELQLQLDDISLAGHARHAIPLTTLASIIARRKDDKHMRPTEAELSTLEGVAASDEPSVHKAIMACSFLVSSIFPELVYEQDGQFQGKGLKIVVKSVNLPVGAGLGSSAAFSVSVSGALFHLRSQLLPDELATHVHAKEVHVSESNLQGVIPMGLLETINRWALGAEVVIHGDPSGLDNTVSCFGSALIFKRELSTRAIDFQSLKEFPPLRIALTNTLVPRETKKLVAGVRKLYEAPPTNKAVECIFDAINSISESFLDLINSSASEQEVVAATGQMVTINHSLLNAIGVGHPALERVVAISASLRLPCKLTGAGGGGCAITILDHHGSAPLKHLLEQEGFALFESKLGGPGVVWHTASSPPPTKREQPEPRSHLRGWVWRTLLATAALSAGAALLLAAKRRSN